MTSKPNGHAADEILDDLFPLWQQPLQQQANYASGSEGIYGRELLLDPYPSQDYPFLEEGYLASDENDAQAQEIVPAGFDNTSIPLDGGLWQTRELATQHFVQPEAWDSNGSAEAINEFDSAFIENPESPPRGRTSSVRRPPQTSASSSWDRIPEFDIALQSDESDILLVTGPRLPSSNVASSIDSSRDRKLDNSDGVQSRGLEASDGSESHSRPGKRKRREFEADELLKVNSVRKVSACIRCQVLKEPCGDGCPCPRCLDINATATIWRGPCFKGRITDVQLFRTKALSFPHGVRRIQAWQSPRKRKISLYNIGYSGRTQSPNLRPKVSVTCQEFVPLVADVLFKKWTADNEMVTLVLPPFAIPSNYMKRTERSLATCVEESWDLLVNEIELGQDEVIALALKEAIRRHKECQMLHAALTICIIARLSSKSFNLTGKETLGIARVEDPVSPYCGRIPIPPLLDAQIDQIWMAMMGKIKKKMLSELKKKIMGRKKEHWYHIFLTLFVLIANLEFVYAVQNDQLNRYCLNKPRQSYPFGSLSMMDSWEHGAENMLAHFRAVFNGSAPFILDWEDEETRVAARLDDDAITHLKLTQSIIAQSEGELRQSRKKTPGNPLVWVSGLFIPPSED